MIHLNKDISSLTIIPMISLIALCKMWPEENYNLQCFFFLERAGTICNG